MFDTRGGLANGLKAVWAPMARCDGLMAAATQVRLVAKPGCWIIPQNRFVCRDSRGVGKGAFRPLPKPGCNGIGFRQISLKMYI